MGSIFSVILGNKSLIGMILLGIVLAGMFIQITVLKNQKVRLQAEKEKVEIQLDQSQANVQQLKSDIEFQNQKIDEFKKDAEARELIGKETIKKANQTAEIYKNRAAELLKKSAPTHTSQCDALNEVINEEIKNAKK